MLAVGVYSFMTVQKAIEQLFEVEERLRAEGEEAYPMSGPTPTARDGSLARDIADLQRFSML